MQKKQAPVIIIRGNSLSVSLLSNILRRAGKKFSESVSMGERSWLSTLEELIVDMRGEKVTLAPPGMLYSISKHNISELTSVC